MRRPEQVLDELLVLRCQGGDAAALELLAERWQPCLLRLARRLTQSAEADETVQEAWVAIARGLGRLEDPAHFGTWAYRIVARKSADWIRRRQRGRRLAAEIAREPAADPAEPGAALERDEQIARLRRALREIPADRRSVLELFYLEELSVRQIARALGVPAGTVKSRLFHARKALRQTLEDMP